MALLIPTEMVLVFLTAFVNTTSLTFSERALLFKNMLPFKTVDFYFLLLHRAVVFFSSNSLGLHDFVHWHCTSLPVYMISYLIHPLKLS